MDYCDLWQENNARASKITAEDISEVLQEYTIGTLKEAVPFDDGCPCRPWKVTTDAGVFVVKEHSTNIRNSLEFEHRLAGWLISQGFPVPKVHLTRGGDMWLDRGERIFAVYQFLPGEFHKQGNQAQARSAGAALAWFHEIADAFPQAETRRVRDSYRPPQLDARFVLEKYPEKEEIHALVNEFTSLDNEFASCHLHQGLLHHDFHIENVLFNGDAFAGAIDLDFCLWGARLCDLAKSILSFAMIIEPVEEDMSIVSFNVEVGRWWLAGYLERNPQLRADLRMLPLVLRRHERVNALYDMRDIARLAQGRWVQHEWDFSRKKMDLVDANCKTLIEGVV